MGHTQLSEAATQWQTEGWVLVDQLVPLADIEPALREAQNLDHDSPESIKPTRRPSRHQPESSGTKFRPEQFSGITLFPLPDAPHVNRLFVHPAIINFATLALQCGDLRVYQSRLWSKYGDGTNYEQPLHRDQNHSLLPTRSEPGWWFMECFLYLCDVDETNGAPSLVHRSRSKGERTKRGPLHRTELVEGAVTDLYQQEVTASGRAGSLLAYRSDVWHRGMPLAPGTERHVISAAYKPAHLGWVGFDEIAPAVNTAAFVAFANERTPQELALFGVPLPGHDYWTTETVEGMALIYPELDLDPWRRALRH